MGIAGIGPSLSHVSLLNALSSTSRCTPGADTRRNHDGSGGSSASASVSPLARSLGQLLRLQQSNPGEFKTVLTDIADKLQAAAEKEGGGQAQALSDLASKFRQAAETGDLSALRPSGHHHGHHHHGAIRYQQASDQTLPTRTSGNGQGGSAATDVRSQVLEIIGQVNSQDLGSVGTGN